MLEAAVKKLFDYQRFEKNASLQGVIDEVLDRYAQPRPVALTDDDLAMAAGGVRSPEETVREPEDDGRETV